MDSDQLRILTGDCLEHLRTLPGESVQCCVTSPPYYGLRDYGNEGQLGLEKTPQEFVRKFVAICEEIRRVLKKDGTFWLNLGDSYANDGKWGGHTGGKHVKALHCSPIGRNKKYTGFKPKDLMGIPWTAAFALRDAGWYLRQDIIWSKPNPMPESVTDRCTKSHEYIFMLSKSSKYYYDADAISEPLASTSIDRLSQANLEQQKGSDRVPGKTNGTMKAVAKQDGHGRRHAGFNQRYFGSDKPYHGKATKDFASGKAQDARATKARIVDRILSGEIVSRNKRSVWSITTKPYKEAHFATFPPEIPQTCIMAGTSSGDTVLDPFAGSGTTGKVALELGRKAILIELNPDYVELIKTRCNITPGLPLT